MKKAIFLYDKTGIMAKPWIDAGYECWLFDGQHESGVNREGNLVKVGMWFSPSEINNHANEIKNMVGDACFVFGFPECTDLAVSGAAHFAKKRALNPEFQNEATILAKLVELVGNKFNCPWGVENPVSVLSTLWRKPNFSFHPWEFGGYLPESDKHPIYPEYIKPRDAYPKKTCIWHGNGFAEPVKAPVEVLPGYSDQHKKLGGKSLKTKNIRSATPRGFAEAVFYSNAVKGSCVKQKVTAKLVSKSGKEYYGENDCLNPQEECPRDLIGFKSGEGYDLCKSICRQTGHAEANAIKMAGSDASDSVIYLTGHTYACDDCKLRAEIAGVNNIIISNNTK